LPDLFDALLEQAVAQRPFHVNNFLREQYNRAFIAGFQPDSCEMFLQDAGQPGGVHSWKPKGVCWSRKTRNFLIKRFTSICRPVVHVLENPGCVMAGATREGVLMFSRK